MNWINKLTYLSILITLAAFLHLFPAEASTVPTPDNNYYLVVNLAARTLTVYVNGQLAKRFPVAIGTPATPTPVGEWKIVHKGTNWGGGFGTRWLGLNVPWGIYGIHGTNKPGSISHAASHGCLRMLNRDVEQLYAIIPVGTMVIVKGALAPLKASTIKPGTSDFRVVSLQAKLKEQGFYLGPADGRYGSSTALAVSYLQAFLGKEPDGIADAETISLLLQLTTTEKKPAS